jgi:hypothetical protein
MPQPQYGDGGSVQLSAISAAEGLGCPDGARSLVRPDLGRELEWRRIDPGHAEREHHPVAALGRQLDAQSVAYAQTPFLRQRERDVDLIGAARRRQPASQHLLFPETAGDLITSWGDHIDPGGRHWGHQK